MGIKDLFKEFPIGSIPILLIFINISFVSISGYTFGRFQQRRFHQVSKPETLELSVPRVGAFRRNYRGDVSQVIVV